MKKLLALVLLMIVFASTLISAQTVYLHCFESMGRNQNTGYVTESFSVDFTIKFNDDKMWVGTANIYTFSGSIIHTSSTQFYVYAYDSEGIRCRVWFQAISKTRANVGIEYNDIAFLYKTTLE